MTIKAMDGIMLSLCAFVTCSALGQAAVPVRDLKATARDGQVFLTWTEDPTPDGTTFNVYMSDRYLGDVTRGQRVGHHIQRHSARDWWEDPSSLNPRQAAGTPVGFRIQAGAERLDPTGGLFVHTVAPKSPDLLYFAVTCTDSNGQENVALVKGGNSLAKGVHAEPGDIVPIWQGAGEPPPVGAGAGLPLRLELHGKGEVMSDMEYLVFGDDTMGWREGLPFKFGVRIEQGAVFVRPTDRVWVNRPHPDGFGGPAIWTFWYGYNSHIYDETQMAQGVPTNYTERWLFRMLDWVGRHYQVDSNRWYCGGASMGGFGTVSFGLHHPERFAALHAQVPVVNLTPLGKVALPTIGRFQSLCGIGPLTPAVKTDEGVALLDRMNGPKVVAETDADLPFLFILNGRRDGSIPWENNPPFYRALNDARQGFAAYWDNNGHGNCAADAPEDVKAWSKRVLAFRRDCSFPAFSNTSSDCNPGNGDVADGDIVGWMNRGMDWTDIQDAPDGYAITLLAAYPGLVYPVKTDLTLRRLQQFKPRAGEKLTVRVGDAAPVSITVDTRGRVTVPGVMIPSPEGVRVVISRPS